MVPEPVAERTSFGRYEIVHPIATGGMGTVYLGRMRAARGVSLTVAIKRINPAFAGDAHVLGMFVDEARITSLVRHPNVVQTLDVVEERGELALVMEYVHGVSLARLLTAARDQGERIAVAVAARIASDVLYGLHAAHEATNEEGKSLEIVHRDVSPQNILIGVDGVTRVADFGIARAAGRLETTALGEVKGKLRYIAPEQFGGQTVDRRADIYGAGLLLWEILVGRPVRRGSSPGGLTSAILTPRLEPPSSFVSGVPPELDDVVLRALAEDPRERYSFALQMATALEAAIAPAAYAVVAEVVRELARDEIAKQRKLLERSAAPPARESVPTLPATIVGGDLTEIATAPEQTVAVISAHGASPKHWAAARAAGRVAGGAAIAALLALVASRSSPPGTVAAPASLPPESSAVSAALVVVPPPVPMPGAAPLPAASAEPAPAANHAAHSKKGHQAPARTPSSKADCTIPYVVDRAGIRVPRLECL